MARLIADTTEPSPESESTWAILDATNAITIVRYLREMDVEHISLYKGELDDRFWDIAPYLARVDRALLDWMRESYWERAWGIVFSSDASLDELRAHFRKFLRVKDMQGRSLYFRFYDPRVLAAFLPRCLPGELKEFYGPVSCYWTPVPRSADFKSFRLGEDEPAEPQPASAAGGRDAR